MIKRILDPEEFKIVVSDIFELHAYDLEHWAHYYVRHNKESIIENFANKDWVSAILESVCLGQSQWR